MQRGWFARKNGGPEGPPLGQREEKISPPFSVIKEKKGGNFLSPLSSAKLASKPEKIKIKKRKGEERKKGRRRRTK